MRRLKVWCKKTLRSSTDMGRCDEAVGQEPTISAPAEAPPTSSSRVFNSSGTPSDQLWDVAYERLREEEETLIIDYEARISGQQGSNRASIRDQENNWTAHRGTILRRKMDAVNQDAWKLRFCSSELHSNGLLKHISSVIEQANHFVASSSSSNPSVSVPWTGVSLLLPLFLNPSDQAASQVTDFEYVSSLIDQSQLWEDLLARRHHAGTNNPGISVAPQLKDALESLYHKILKFQASSYCYYAVTTAFRFGLDSMEWSEWDTLLAGVREQECTVSALVDSWRDDEYRHACSAAQERHQEGVRQLVEGGIDVSSLKGAIQYAHSTQPRIGLLRWLCEVDPSPLYKAARDKQIEGTCDWLVKESEEFKTWEESPRSLLWIFGRAGTGKSVLSSSIIKHLNDRHESDPQTALAYYFFDFSDGQKHNTATMLTSLIRQLCIRRPLTPLDEWLCAYKDKGMRPDLKSLEEFVVISTRGFRNVHIIIDALDECPVENGEREKVLKSLCNIIGRILDNTHVLCTSRKEADITEAMSRPLSSPSAITVDLTECRSALNHDIRIFVDSVLGSRGDASWSPEAKAKAREALINKANGSFQYALNHLEELLKCSSLEEVQGALEDLPTGLDETYDRLLQSLDSRFIPQVKNILMWLAFSTRLMLLDELAEVFILHPERPVVFDLEERLSEPRSVLEHLSGLVVTHSRPMIGLTLGKVEIRLAHFSIKEYLTSSRIKAGPAAQFSFTPKEAHLNIAQSCLAYHLQHSSWEEMGWLAGVFKLRDYAARHWMEHLEIVPRRSWPSSIQSAAARALAARSYSLWAIVQGKDCGPEKYSLADRPEHFTARFGYTQLTDLVLSGRKYLTQEDLDSTIQHATFGGHLGVVQLLLDRGANVNPESAEFGDALQAAVKEGHEEVVALLLDNGADINAQRGPWGSPIQAAAGRLNLLKLLVSHRADINLPSNKAGCAVTSVIQRGKLLDRLCLQFLLDSGADINKKGDGNHGTALHAAAALRHDAVFRLLVQRGADVNSMGGEYGFPLQAACASSRMPLSVVKLLLDKGADVNAQGGTYGTALQATCNRNSIFSDYKDIAELLLQHGADINAQGGMYGNALQAACCHSQPRLVQFLLDSGADVNAEGGDFGNALQAASASWDNENEVVKLLLKSGVNVNAKGGRYATALQAATHTGNIERVRLLLGHGADVNIQGGWYGTALQAALEFNKLELVKILLEHGADVNAQGGEYGTALQATCASISAAGNTLEIVTRLLDRGADVHVQGGKYGCAWLAAHGTSRLNAMQARVRSLIPSRSPLDGDRNAANRIAVEDEVLLRLFLDHGIDVNDTSGGRNTALQALLEFNSGSDTDYNNTIRFQFKNGHRLGDLPKDVRVLLDYYERRICMLLDRGANVNLECGTYGFPLQSACVGEYAFKSVEILLEKCPEINVNAQGGLFGSALQAAVASGQITAARLLLEKGADVGARGGKYHSALNAAVIRGFWDVAEMLLEAGATPDCEFMLVPDEDWLVRVYEEDGRGAVERYRMFLEVQQEEQQDRKE